MQAERIERRQQILTNAAELEWAEPGEWRIAVPAIIIPRSVFQWLYAEHEV